MYWHPINFICIYITYMYTCIYIYIYIYIYMAASIMSYVLISLISIIFLLFS